MVSRYFPIESEEYRARVRPKLIKGFQKIDFIPSSWSLAEGYQKGNVIIGYDGKRFMGIEAPTKRAIERTRLRLGLEATSETKFTESKPKNGRRR